MLDENYAVPHCVENLGLPLVHFIGRPLGVNFILYNFDRSVLDFSSWKVAHGVVLTAQRLISFGLHMSQHCCAECTVLAPVINVSLLSDVPCSVASSSASCF